MEFDSIENIDDLYKSGIEEVQRQWDRAWEHWGPEVRRLEKIRAARKNYDRVPYVNIKNLVNFVSVLCLFYHYYTAMFILAGINLLIYGFFDLCTWREAKLKIKIQDHVRLTTGVSFDYFTMEKVLKKYYG